MSKMAGHKILRSQIFYKKVFTNRQFLDIIYKNYRKEMIVMKILWYTGPQDIDELIFAGEETVASDR